ncbi:MAG TPA: 4-hydroxyphenylpyruvate dioxygenase [Ktedonobacteraceae bacterium]|jgi:4-hydroxyphenylpyruvate dioxygenase|nr:4-hydroxyphenylpyruvate dioxygenase [Ktedonobacteraceae bacterium]
MSTINQDELSLSETVTPQLQGVDYVELYVSNARQAAHYYRTAFGFVPVAYAGLETGTRDRLSIVMKRDECFLLLTSPLNSESPISHYLSIHGDGMKDIAFRVKDASQAFAQAIKWGARPLVEPTVLEDEQGRVVRATVAVYGDVVHSFVQREGFQGTFLPTYQALPSLKAPETGLYAIDHFAISLPPGEVQRWVDFYTQAFHFYPIHEEAISTEFSSMSSKAIQDRSESIKFVLIEPRPGQRKSQIEEFLKFHQGAGVQHLALHSHDIIKTIHTLEENGVGFVSAPDSYYEMLAERVGVIVEDTQSLRDVNVLVDRDEWGYLLQIFSLPVQSRPTFFIELIQRKGGRGFGSGNIQALFRALEREQARRGNL